MLLPSEPYRRLMFEFGLLSWFHFYVACCTSVAVLHGMASVHASQLRAAGLAVRRCSRCRSARRSSPAPDSCPARSRSSTRSSRCEARTSYSRTRSDPPSHGELLQLAAARGTAAARVLRVSRLARARARPKLYYAIAATIGLALLLDQLRLHYFGFFAFVTGGLLLLDDLASALDAGIVAPRSSRRSRSSLLRISRRCANGCSCSTPGATPSTGTPRLYLELQKLCAADPGLVLASTDDGNRVLFHSDCSVIANNFILRPEDARHIDEVRRLMRLDPGRDTAPTARREVRAAARRGLRRDQGRRRGAWPLVARSRMQLLARTVPPPGYEFVATVHWRLDDEAPTPSSRGSSRSCRTTRRPRVKLMTTHANPVGTQLVHEICPRTPLAERRSAGSARRSTHPLL